MIQLEHYWPATPLVFAAFLTSGCLATPTASILSPTFEADSTGAGADDVEVATAADDDGRDSSVDSDVDEDAGADTGVDVQAPLGCPHAAIQAAVGCGVALVVDGIYDAELVDHNADGCQDIVFTSYEPANLVVLYGNDAGDWTCARSTPLATPGGKPARPHGFVVADLDGVPGVEAFVLTAAGESFWLLGMTSGAAGFEAPSRTAEVSADYLQVSTQTPTSVVTGTFDGAGADIVFGDVYNGWVLYLDWSGATIPTDISHLVRLDGGGTNQLFGFELRHLRVLPGTLPGFDDLLAIGRYGVRWFHNKDGDLNDNSVGGSLSEGGAVAWSVLSVADGVVDAIGISPSAVQRHRWSFEPDFVVQAAEGLSISGAPYQDIDDGVAVDLDGAGGAEVLALDADAGGGPGSSSPPYSLFLYSGLKAEFPLAFAHPQDSVTFSTLAPVFTPRRVLVGDTDGNGTLEVLVVSSRGMVRCYRENLDHDLESCP